MPSLKCPFCGEASDCVVDSRMVFSGEFIRRRRECLACGERFTTRERVVVDAPKRAQYERHIREKVRAR